MSIARLVGALEERTFPAGEVILREGAEANGLYLLERGEVAVSVRSEGGDVEVARESSPGHFGDMGVLLARRTATVRAIGEVVVRRLPREPFEQLIRERPEVALVVATSLADRLEQRQRALIGAPEVQVEARPLTIERSEARRPGRASRMLGIALPFMVPLALWWLP
ncbi:MAG TPA: cyclic nucleotide-binding domain-containing protein, partial [Candidatus Limnocylindria bacterium]